MAEQVTAFFEGRVIARGTLEAVTREVEDKWPNDQGAVQAFDDESGRVVDLNLWGAAPRPPRGRGRPKLGVVAREVTLLPRQWEWLAQQPGGASATLRRLVDSTRKNGSGRSDARDAVYRFITALAGDRPGYEEALRALYRSDLDGFRDRIADWPEDIRLYAEALLKV